MNSSFPLFKTCIPSCKTRLLQLAFSEGKTKTPLLFLWDLRLSRSIQAHCKERQLTGWSSCLALDFLTCAPPPHQYSCHNKESSELKQTISLVKPQWAELSLTWWQERHLEAEQTSDILKRSSKDMSVRSETQCFLHGLTEHFLFLCLLCTEKHFLLDSPTHMLVRFCSPKMSLLRTRKGCEPFYVQNTRM